MKKKYCECENPDFEKDENNYEYCLICGQESERNNREPDFYDEEEIEDEKNL